jgi:hypothetical protein
MKRILNFIYCIGAAVVIIGAYAKIVHIQFADLFLTIGLVTEAIIFIIFGFQELTEKKIEGIPEIKLPEGRIGDSWELNESIKNLNKTIQKVFNQ